MSKKKDIAGIVSREVVDMNLQSLSAAQGQEGTGPLEIFYSGVEGAKDHYANTAECMISDGTMLIRFFHQRPLRRAGIAYEKVGTSLKTSMGQYDAIEFAQQTSVVLSLDAAKQLMDMIGGTLQALEKKEG